jgi:hypothetical protein
MAVDTGEQLDLFAEIEAPRCPLCGCPPRLHLPLDLIHEDRRGCRTFTCYCPGREPRSWRKQQHDRPA